VVSYKPHCVKSNQFVHDNVKYVCKVWERISRCNYVTPS
jgi:hypothetical protein